MTKETPEKFAKAIMMELATIHAYVETVHAYHVEQIVQAQDKPRQEISDTLTVHRAKRVKELYDEMLRFSEMQA